MAFDDPKTPVRGAVIGMVAVFALAAVAPLCFSAGGNVKSSG